MLVNVMNLLFLYFNIILCFTLAYLLLDMSGLGPIVDNTQEGETRHWTDIFFQFIYFSGMTMASGGYGDIIPLGWSRIVAVTEAMIGMILPIALVLNTILFPFSSFPRAIVESLNTRSLRKRISSVKINKN